MLGKATLAAALGLSMAGSAWAQSDSSLRPYINFGPQYVFADDTRESDDGIGAYFGVGTPVTRWFGIETNVFYDQFKGKSGGPDWSEFGFEAGALLTVPTNGNWVPYLGGTVGVARSDNDSETSWDPQGAIGGGLFAYFDKLGVRLDVRYRGIDLDNDKYPLNSNPTEVVTKLGLVIPFGEPIIKPEEPKAAPVVKSPDADGDGIPDDKDRCPDTPKGVKVDAEGCPIEVGGEQPIIADVYFAFNSEKLSPDAVETLNKVLATLNSKQTLKIVLKGHTDAIGTDGYNQALSERRANSVRAYLQKRGVTMDRLNLEAYGETRPVADNTTDEGRAKNRRVEIRSQ